MRRLLVQTQLSNYDGKGKFILEADSGWQMVMGRVRNLMVLDPELCVDVMCPLDDQCVTCPADVNHDMYMMYGDDGDQRLRFIEHRIIPNALVTRYDFDWTNIAIELDLGMHAAGRLPKYDAVYVNDPMHLRAFRALFHVVGKYTPKFFVHSHFIDNPECPKFPTEASLWLGQCEAAIKADHNFWQCRTSMDVFFDSMSKTFMPDVVNAVKAKSMPWDDGYSIEEINVPVDASGVRFDQRELARARAEGKTILFVPNRVGGKGRSSDYTNCGKFMFDVLPALRARRQDVIVVAGNPNQKFTNDELAHACASNGYVKLVPDALNRDEYRLVASMADIVVGLYDQDTYGGTASRECIDMGCLPLWLDMNEYSRLAKLADWDHLVDPSMSDIVDRLDDVIEVVKRTPRGTHRLKDVVREECSYESTTKAALEVMRR